MLHRKSGALLLVSLAFLVSGCPSKDFPPPFEIICTGDGFGGCNASLKDGTRKKLLPSEMKNMWCTSQTDIAKFTAWAYGMSSNEVDQKLSEFMQRMQKPQAGPVQGGVKSPQLKIEPGDTSPEMTLPHEQTGEPYDPNKNL